MKQLNDPAKRELVLKIYHKADLKSYLKESKVLKEIKKAHLQELAVKR